MSLKKLSTFDYVTVGFIAFELLLLLFLALEFMGVSVFVADVPGASGREFLVGLMTAVATLVAVGVAYLAYQQSRENADRIDEQERRREQAYVHADKAFLERSGSGGFAVQFRFLNSGQTPATHFVYSASAIEVPRGSVRQQQVPKFDLKDQPRWPAIGGLGDARTARWRDDEPSFSAMIQNRLNNPERQNRSVVLIMGIVRYETIYREAFETEFAFYFTDVEAAMTKMSRSTNFVEAFRPAIES